MGRGRKLFIVGLVLLTGIVLAWPFRKTASDREAEVPTRLRQSEMGMVTLVPADRPIGQPAPASEVADSVPSLQTRVMGLGVSTPIQEQSRGATSFDLADHPALSDGRQPLSMTTSPVTPAVPPATLSQDSGSYFPGDVQRTPRAKPAYDTVTGNLAQSHETQSPEIRHVVQNSDTLEKIAKRYLGDEGRALEIFDLNRDLLDNPHLLPIHAELRIPQDANYHFD